MRNCTLAVVLGIVMAWGAVAMAAPEQNPAAIEQHVRALEPGSTVEVRQSAQPKKLRGRIGEVNKDGFVLEIVDGNETVAKKLAFEQVKSVRKLEPRPETAQRTGPAGVMWRGLAVLAYLFSFVAEP